MAFGIEELIVPALIIVAIIVFYKIFKNNSKDVAKKMGKEVEEVKKMTKELPQAFRDGVEEFKKEHAEAIKEKGPEEFTKEYTESIKEKG